MSDAKVENIRESDFRKFVSLLLKNFAKRVKKYTFAVASKN